MDGPTSTLLSDALKGLALDKDEYVTLLGKLIGESRHVQNNPRQGLVPKESLVCAHLMNVLQPYKQENGGPLLVKELIYTEGRPNLKITYPGTSSKCTAFVGSHMDVVPANPETWERDPFTLSFEEGNKLYGRGTTDCLGHVALITLFMKALAVAKPTLERSVVVCFIAAEESFTPGVGVDMVVKNGVLDELKNNGTVYWIDCADSQPCIGTGGAMTWHLKATGRIFHSGMPHRGINSIELASEATGKLQQHFYDTFPPHPSEAVYNFATPSTMKPTQVDCAKGALNQICPWTTMSGDIRLTPFYDPVVVMKSLDKFVQHLNENGMDSLPTRGPCSKYTLTGDNAKDVDISKGKIELSWTDDEVAVRQMEGIACDLDSQGLKAISEATKEVKGVCTPFAMTGSLPLVRKMQDAGFDIQITGYGLSKTYHADNEYALLSDMQDAFSILLRIISIADNN